MTMIKPNLHDVEIRKLPASVIIKLCGMLDSSDGWKKLMAVVPVACNEENSLKYTVEHIKTIENEGNIQGSSRSAIFLDEWGTSGKCRPTLSFLLKCLIKANLYRAADYVALELLKQETAPDRPAEGPAAPVLCPFESCEPSAPPLLLPSTDSQSSSTPPNSTRLAGSLSDALVKVSYLVLEAATAKFAKERVLGEGAFGTVYRAIVPGVGEVAVKKIHSNGAVGDPTSQFYNEVKVLAELKHTNLLPLLAYSTDGPALCLAYAFMKNGSLEDQLASETSRNRLKWKTRVEIALGTARGLCHLHTALQEPLVHRDVKTANILLDDKLTPKLGDFGLVRLGSQGLHSHSVALVSTMAGTRMYMSPEALRGQVSTKMDVFSFGVVLFELLTGLPPYDEDRKDRDLVSYIEGCEKVEMLLDQEAGNWSQDVSSGMFQLALDCLEPRYLKRPHSSMLVQKLEHFLS